MVDDRGLRSMRDRGDHNPMIAAAPVNRRRYSLVNGSSATTMVASRMDRNVRWGQNGAASGAPHPTPRDWLGA